MRATMKWSVVALGALLLLGVLWIAVAAYSRTSGTPEEAIETFYAEGRAEDQLMDPLILAGSDVIPLVEKELLNPNMPQRRYAIGALGNIGSQDALPILQNILGTRAEPDYIRCDALTAIALIDRDQGMQAADKFSKDAECLTELHEDLNHRYDAWRDSVRRTYLDALIGRHS
jgi:hypothetical protein